MQTVSQITDVTRFSFFCQCACKQLQHACVRLRKSPDSQSTSVDHATETNQLFVWTTREVHSNKTRSIATKGNTGTRSPFCWGIFYWRTCHTPDMSHPFTILQWLTVLIRICIRDTPFRIPTGLLTNLVQFYLFAGKFLRGCTTGGSSRRAQLRK
jgi:hypothetical protein